MPYQRWTVQLMPLTASFEKGFTLPASIVKPFIGIGAGCCLIGETTYLPDGLSNAEKTSTFLWHVYLGSEVRIFRSMALSVGYRRQFGVYEVVFGGATGTSAQVNIGGSNHNVNEKSVFIPAGCGARLSYQLHLFNDACFLSSIQPFYLELVQINP